MEYEGGKWKNIPFSRGPKKGNPEGCILFYNTVLLTLVNLDEGKRTRLRNLTNRWIMIDERIQDRHLHHLVRYMSKIV